MVRSVDVCPAGFCFITVTQIRMNKNSPLDQRYICPMGADGLQRCTRISSSVLSGALMRWKKGGASSLGT